MTSGHFENVDPSKIWVNRETRQRRELKGIPELQDSIRRIGLIHPPIITRDFELRTGERRWTAILGLGWTSIPVQWADELSEPEAIRLELEENIKRLDIEWPERAKGILAYHRSMLIEDDDWTQVATADALGLTPASVGQAIDVAKELLAGNKLVIEAPKFSTARGIAARQKERKQAAAAISITAAIDPKGAEEAVAKAATIPLLHADFHEWAAAYTGPRHFNFIHCDFPYGVNADKADQGQAAAMGGYEDSFDVYEHLISTLLVSMGNVIADSAHLVFWFSMDYYQYTRDRLEEGGWKVNPFPLVWHKSDGSGILPDPARGPRRTYETAFLASRGDRKIIRAKTNSFAWPGKDKSIHMSEKPVPMLKHFMEMLVDDTTVMVDPTSGSGNAVKAAAKLGAGSVLGLERDVEFYNRAKEAYFDE